MKVAVLCPQSPDGVVGGAERLWQGLVDAVNRADGHTAELIAHPCPERTLGEVIASYDFFDKVVLDDFDAVITGKYPAWMVRHSRHIVHMCHPLRGLYDAYPTTSSTFAQPVSGVGRHVLDVVRRCAPGERQSRARVLSAARRLADQLDDDHPDMAFPGPLSRELVQWLDADALHPSRVRRYAAISATVAQRPNYFPSGVSVEVLIPPSGLVGLTTDTYKTVFTASRLDAPKRVGLIIDAMRHVPDSCTLRIAGTGPEEQALRRSAADDPRIEFLGRIDDDQLVREYARACVVPFVPWNEDLGLIVLEAQMSAKPVITCTDSGGAAELVDHGIDGFVVDPTPEHVGSAISSLLRDRPRAQQMGARGAAKASRLTWPALVDGLLSEPTPEIARTTSVRPRVVVLSTYPASPARHGGQIRVNRIYREVAARYDVDLIAYSHEGASGVVSPGFHQTIVRPCDAVGRLCSLAESEANAPLGDVAAFLAAASDDDLLARVSSASRGASAVVVAQPYLISAVRTLDPRVKVVHDSQNYEVRLKSEIYPATDLGRALLEAVRAAESSATSAASLVTAVSDDDALALQEQTATMANFATVPNGVDFDAVEFVTGGDRRTRRIRWLDGLRRSGLEFGGDAVALFVGSAHPPNVAAAGSILEIARQLPDVLFVLAGSHASYIGIPTGPNVVARGFVSHHELATLLSVSTVALNPVTTGSGTNLKLLEYFASGTPVVSSRVGARGFDVDDGVHLIVAEVADFGAAIRQIAGDSDRADALARSAREVARRLDWTLLGQQYAGALDELLGAG